MADRRKGHPPRLAGWDYAAAGPYFVTFKVADRRPSLGAVGGGTVRLTALGEVVQACWLGLPVRFPGLGLDAMVIMPDHVHSILWLPGALMNQGPTGDPAGRKSRLQPLMTDSRVVLGKVIRSWKAESTRGIRRAGDPSFRWQSRFYERIIRDERSLDRIRAYVANNPRRHGERRTEPPA